MDAPPGSTTKRPRRANGGEVTRTEAETKKASVPIDVGRGITTSSFYG